MQRLHKRAYAIAYLSWACGPGLGPKALGPGPGHACHRLGDEDNAVCAFGHHYVCVWKAIFLVDYVAMSVSLLGSKWFQMQSPCTKLRQMSTDPWLQRGTAVLWRINIMSHINARVSGGSMSHYLSRWRGMSLSSGNRRVGHATLLTLGYRVSWGVGGWLDFLVECARGVSSPTKIVRSERGERWAERTVWLANFPNCVPGHRIPCDPCPIVTPSITVTVKGISYKYPGQWRWKQVVFLGSILVVLLLSTSALVEQENRQRHQQSPLSHNYFKR